MSEKLINTILGIIILTIFFLSLDLFVNREKKSLYNELESKGIKSVGFIKKVSSIRTRKNVEYKYLINGKTYNSSHPINNQEYNSISKFRFYPIVYHKKDPNVSKLITNSFLNPEYLIDNGIYINGKITKILECHYPVLDLFINYNFNNQYFSFRTRLHKDSLNCGTIEKCKNDKIIKLKISQEYPFFNDLYFKSRDRQKRKYQHLD